MDKSINNINLQELQASTPKQFSETSLAFMADRYSGSRINPTALYMAHFNTIPNIIRPERSIVCKQAQSWLIDNFRQDIKDVYFDKNPGERGSKLEYDEVYYLLFEDMLIYFNTGVDEVLLYFRSTPMKTIDHIMTGLQKFKRRVTTKPEISLVVASSTGLDTHEMEISRRSIDIEHNYNDDFNHVHEIMMKRLSKKNDKGIILLHGKPGTGKTTYIRHIIAKLKKRVIFLPVEIAPQLTSPTFMNLLIEHPNSVFVIEDAENIVIDRNVQNGSPVAGLLNLADGLLADCLNIQLICTFNTDLSKIDPALMRKGRLIASYEFRELDVAKAQKLSNKLGFESKINQPMTLTDIYNQQEQDFKVRRSGTGIGFRVA